ncbi:ABC-2 transporter permease [Anaerocolumna sp. MB42-C2]|uniref:ABC-2 transporter permease n=1 Tax=Anaerocolumna sp. MB42-C2 TaxID=3070997 RepID=UPI0027DFD670|nr:ABC-2 transporter permease [Anaerocolumna sp. MB42-C2]WMJ89237.1 ABC-2 transporter permease [Anaerocolumna sp. MB42-C2]
MRNTFCEFLKLSQQSPNASQLVLDRCSIGLLKNSFYGAIGSAIIFLIVFLTAGLVLLITGSPALLNVLVVISATAFAINAVSGFRKEASTKWNKYELAAPVRRKDIVKSRYISYMSWIIFGIILSAVFAGLAVLVHGNLYFYHVIRDPLTLFCLSIGIALLMGTLYYPAIYLFGADRNEVIIIISLLDAVGIAFAIIWLINAGNDFNVLSDPEYYFFIALFLGIVIILFLLSYVLTVAIYRRKEY